MLGYFVRIGPRKEAIGWLVTQAEVGQTYKYRIGASEAGVHRHSMAGISRTDMRIRPVVGHSAGMKRGVIVEE